MQASVKADIGTAVETSFHKLCFTLTDYRKFFLAMANFGNVSLEKQANIKILGCQPYMHRVFKKKTTLL